MRRVRCPRGTTHAAYYCWKTLGLSPLQRKRSADSSGVSKLDTPSTAVVLVRINDDGHQMHRTLSVGARDKT